MVRLFSRIAAAIILTSPLVAGACTLSQFDSRTIVVTAASSDCKFSEKEVKQLRAQLSQALAALPAQPATPAVIQAAQIQSKSAVKSTNAVPQFAEIDTRTSKQRRQFVERM